MIEDYRLLTANNPVTLREAVLDAVKSGYELYGVPFYTGERTTVAHNHYAGMFCQAVVKQVSDKWIYTSRRRSHDKQAPNTTPNDEVVEIEGVTYAVKSE